MPLLSIVSVVVRGTQAEHRSGQVPASEDEDRVIAEVLGKVQAMTLVRDALYCV